jgi:4-amino-4-deoxy-L-arabinose transferase-like glycosyltransferase
MTESSTPRRITTAAFLREHGWIWGLAVLVASVHLAFAARYDIFRNELYYIVCGWHPAFGYADQPPLVPLIAAATQIFGVNAWLLRVPAALAAAALVMLTAAFARLLGGGRRTAFVAAFATTLSPALVALTQILTTSTFEALGWTASAYWIARGVVRGEGRAWLWAGVAAGLSMEAKYGIALWLAGAGIGLAVLPERRVLARREVWLGLAVAVAIALPSVIWQAWHGWPFIQVMTHHTVGHTNFTGTPLQFEIGQALAMNALLLPLWTTGLVAPFIVARLKPVRFVTLAYLVTAAMIIGLRGKDYYLFPAYPALFAIGAVACARLTLWLAAPWLALTLAAMAAMAPLALPMLDPPALARYMDRMHLHPAPDEAAAVGAPLTQVYSDELGWRALEKKVAAIYHALPPEDQRRAAIIGSNYGEAAAIDVYGVADNLPPALSGQDQYYFWGPRGYDGSVVIHINGNAETLDRWRHFCASMDMAGTFGAPFVMPYENGRPIFVCRGLPVPLPQAWPRFKRFQ